MPKVTDKSKKRSKIKEVEKILLQLGIWNSSNEASAGRQLPRRTQELLSNLTHQRLGEMDYAELERLANHLKHLMMWQSDSASSTRLMEAGGGVEQDDDSELAVILATRSLHRAAESGDLVSCQQALCRVRSVDCQDACGSTALHCAARAGQAEVAQQLLSSGASIDARDQDGVTPLMLAVAHGQHQLVRLLSGSGTDLSVKNGCGFTAADLAFAAGDLQSLRLLEEKQPALQFDAALHSETLPELVRQSASDCVRYWLDNYPNGLDVNPCDLQYKDGQTVAHVAARLGLIDFLHLIEERSGNFDIPDLENSSPLFWAAQAGAEAVGEFLLKRNCKVNQVCNSGRTPLFAAIEGGHVAFVKMLLAADADVGLKDKQGKCPVAYSIELGNQEIFNCLLEKRKESGRFEDNAEHSLIYIAADNSQFEMLEQLHQAGLSLDIPRANDGQTAVMAACRSGSAEAVAYLAQNRCDLNRSDRAGNTPALLAAASGHLNVLAVLSNFSAKLDEANAEYKTPILVAASSADNALETVDFLLNQGSNVGVADKNGNTVASFAASALNYPLIELLIERRAPMDLADGKGNTPLMKAIMAQSDDHALTYRIVEVLCLCGCRLSFKNNKGNTAVSMAAKMGRLDLLAYFAAKGEKLTNINRKGKTILMQVAAKNQVNAIRYLHRESPEEYANKNATDEFGRTVVHFAAMKGCLDSLEYLVNNLKCTFDTKYKGGHTPFMLAVKEGNKDVAKSLADLGADINLRNNQGENAVHLASQGGFLELIKLLERKDCCLDQEDKTGKTPLMIACAANNLPLVEFLQSREVLLDSGTRDNRRAIHFACEAGALKIVQRLIDRGVSIDCTDSAGVTTLMLAALAGSSEIVKLLIDRKPSLAKARDKYGKTALEYAILGQNSQLLYDLIRAGCDVNNRKSNGRTPLLIAIEAGKIDADRMVQTLLDNGSDREAVTDDGFNAAHLACKCDRLGVLKILIERGFPITEITKSGDSCLTLAVANASAEMIDLLIHLGLDKSLTNNSGNSAISLACLRGDEEVLSKFLPASEADLVKVYADGNTLLHCACTGISKNMVESLIECDESKLQSQNSNLETPLHVACRGANPELVEFLLQKGANPNAIDAKGETPIFGAVQSSCSINVCRLLIAKKADINALNVDGVSVLAAAFHRGSRQIIDLLLAEGAKLSPEGLPFKFEVFKSNILSRRNRNLMELLDLGLSVNRREGNRYILDLAIETCRSQLIEELLSRGASVAVKDEKGNTPLLMAIKFGQIDLAKRILREHPESKDDAGIDGDSLLHVAVSAGKLSTVQWLMSEVGFPKDAKNRLNETALHVAAKLGSEQIFQLLIDKGWDPDQLGRGGRTALQLAAESSNSRFALALHARRSHSDAECTSLFYVFASTGQTGALKNLSRYASCKQQAVNIRDSVVSGGNQYTFYWMTSRDGLNHSEIIQRLNEANENGETALTIAVRLGNFHLCQKLVHLGCSLGVKTKNGLTLVHEAVAADSEPILRFLVKDKDVPANEPDVNGDTPLLESISLGRTRMLEVFHKDFGCNLGDARNRLSRNAAHLAAISGNADILCYLKENVSREEFFNRADVHGDTPLMLSVLHEKTDAARFLLENISLDLDHQNETGSCALHWAAAKSNLTLIQALLTRGATVDSKNSDGATALMLSAQETSVQCVRALLDAEASPIEKNRDGHCALSYMLNSTEAEIRELGERLRAQIGIQQIDRPAARLSAHLTALSNRQAGRSTATAYQGVCAGFSSNPPQAAADRSSSQAFAAGSGPIAAHTPQSQQ